MSRDRPWYKRDAAQAINGMIGLNPAERGVYSTLIDLAYDRGGPFEEREKDLAIMCGCGPRLYRKLRDALLERGKLIRLDDGRLIVKGFNANGELPGNNFGTNSTDIREEKLTGNSSKTSRTPLENSSNTARKSLENEAASNENKGLDGALTRARTAAANEEDILTSDKNDSTRANDEGQESGMPPSVFEKSFLLADVLGIELLKDSSRLNWEGIIDRMIGEGLELEDILQTAREMKAAGRLKLEVRTPAFFREGARLRRAKRQATHKPRQVDTSKVTELEWLEDFQTVMSIGLWQPAIRGPSPFEPGCQAPAKLLEAARKNWEAQGNHPKRYWKDGANYASDWVPGKSEVFPEVKPFWTGKP